MARETITTYEALEKFAEACTSAPIRGLRPMHAGPHTAEVLSKMHETGLHFYWEWSWAVEAQIGLQFHSGLGKNKKERMVARPVIRVNWPASARLPIEAQVSLQLYQLVTDLACRMEVELGRYDIVQVHR